MESIMENAMALQTQRYGKVKISKANAWCMVSTTTSRIPQQTIHCVYLLPQEALASRKISKRQQEIDADSYVTSI
jgi:hypothetical protein